MAELDTRPVNPALNRPLSPHLGIYRPMLTMMMSITHRITGAALYAGTLIGGVVLTVLVWIAAYMVR